jgi:hypothetical protein
MGLPFRGVVRRISGAHKRDQKREHAILAAIARRGFLKGVDRKSCTIAPPLQAATEAPAGPASITIEAPPLIPDGQAASPQ